MGKDNIITKLTLSQLRIFSPPVCISLLGTGPTLLLYYLFPYITSSRCPSCLHYFCRLVRLFLSPYISSSRLPLCLRYFCAQTPIFSVKIHTENFFLNFINPNRIWNEITIYRIFLYCTKRNFDQCKIYRKRVITSQIRLD